MASVVFSCDSSKTKELEDFREGPFQMFASGNFDEDLAKDGALRLGEVLLSPRGSEKLEATLGIQCKDINAENLRKFTWQVFGENGFVGLKLLF